ncbi:MAG: acyl-CoA dehydrogenase family protein [Pseudodonghicola sp.]|nr:acyl-CoA dehydrogenase family protein [Pseudodonghicola sp.]
MLDPVDALNTDDMRALAKLAIDNFVPRGRDYDARSVMPKENIQDLHEGGWLTATLPKAMGGKGSNVDSDEDPSTFIQGLRMIARGCPGTAHCYQVTNHTAWAVNDLGTPEQKERFLAPMFERPFLGSFVGSEAKRKHMYMMNTTAKRVEGGYIVRGEKNYATNGSDLGFAVIFAAIEGVDNYLDNHLMVIIEPDMEGVSIDTSWYRPNGMRCADSPVITLNDVFVPDTHVLGQPGDYVRQRWQGKFHLGFTANYLGATEGMYQWYLDYVTGRGKGEAEMIQMRTGEMKIALDGAVSIFHDAIRAYRTRPIVEAELLAMSAKSIAADVAFELSHKIIHAAGSTALFDQFPLSRYLRDLETHVLHAGHDRTAQIIGQAELKQAFDSTLQR